MKCLICNSENTDRVNICPNAEFYRHCCSCGSIYLIDNNQIQKNIYVQDYLKDNKESVHIAKSYGKLLNHFKPIINLNIVAKPIHFLEVGFASCGVLIEAVNSGWIVDGVDVHIPENIKNTLKHVKSVRLFECSIFDWEPDKKYDCIWLTHFIEHFSFEDIKQILTNVHKWLNPNGLLFLSSPDAELYNDLNYGLWIIQSNCKPKEHYVLYTADTFYNSIKHIGFERVFKQRFMEPNNQFTYHTKGEWRMLLKSSNYIK